MPRLEGMYAPGNECAHLLPPAGFPLPFPSDVFQFNRVAPYYPPDPCIRPNEGDLTCPMSCPPQPVNHPCMPPAGTDTRLLSDVFRFHKVYPSTGCNPCKQAHPPTCSCTTGPFFKYKLHEHDRMANNSVPGFNMSSTGPYNNHMVSNVSKCMNASMYNNTSTSSVSSSQKLCRSQCFPDPCAVTGNMHYNSLGYSTDRSCTQLPVQRADKVVDFSAPCPHCPHHYYPSCYVCRPVYNRKYLLDCPEQDGPPADTYTFL
ncbi:unnamed protein product [Candidula unifasciata]|uniref:Uncharacterized protein n=1 Tax=Candidula unifasciata TaxID=100452 RepID=A0A8S3ZZN7_9EUPU|nr:unnamed protein product [Candidula unifasciata]